MAETSDVFDSISKLQFHYWFSDKTHTMDALVHNKCERELLEITRAVAKICGVSVKLETEPSGKGGLKSWLTITAKSPRKTPAIKIALVNMLVASSIVTPAQTSAGQVADVLFTTMLADKELNESEREQLLRDIGQLKGAAANLMPLLDQHAVVKKRKSNFYELLRKYQKVKSISVTLTDDARRAVAEEQMVVRDGFKSFVSKSDSVPPEVIGKAQIEIISPVLVKGKHKWKGNYNGLPISFVMKSDEFMEMVQQGKVEFKSGSSISCTLEIEKKVNSAGVERTIGYNILQVDSYSENGKILETTLARQKQKQPEPVVSKRQLDLFG